MHWDISPEIFSLGPISLRWYGVLFATGFYLGFRILRKVFLVEGRPVEDVDPLLMYMVLGTIVGARIGHCLFYEPEYFLAHPLEIIKIWQGGLASHGAVAGICLSLWLYSKKRISKWKEMKKKGGKHPGAKLNLPTLWIYDRIAIAIGLGGALVRVGNLMNSEILGKPTNAPWGVIFERVDGVPRHPAQLYEAIVYFLFFVFAYRYYLKKKEDTPRGILCGAFFVVAFSLRFLIEQVKENQVAFESYMTINMGQVLSIPVVLIGIWMIIRSRKIPLEKN